MAITTFPTLGALAGAVGSHLGSSSWIEITQQRIDDFADATDDHQWIHVDRVRAAAGPFGGTIAHGYLTLSLAFSLLERMVEVDGQPPPVPAGTARVRFPSPVPTGGRIRAVATIGTCSQVGEGVEAGFDVTVELEGAAKPACVAHLLLRFGR